MGFPALMFGLFMVGYLLGVWATCIVLHKGRSEVEEGVIGPQPMPVISDPRILR